MLLVVFAVLLTLKLVGAVTFSWWLVCLPLLVIPMLYVGIWVVVATMWLFTAMFSPISTLARTSKPSLQKVMSS